MTQQTVKDNDNGREAMAQRVQFVDDKLNDFRRHRQFPDDVPTVEEMKQWVNEAMRTADERLKEQGK